MSASEEERAPTDLATWDRLLNEQTVLFRKTASRNAELETQVEELQRELSVWKAALKTADEETKTLQKTVGKLERNIDSLRADNPLVLCIIDGDGNIFLPELIVLGQAGGRQAAMLLTKGLTEHLENIDSPEKASAARGQIWLTIYCNKTGLIETLLSHELCTREQFEAFIVGFNQASPLFSIVDVGNGKEAADAKVKECLRVFTRFPQTMRVFFGGAHDNGYTSTLTYLENEGLLDKVIILRGYRDVAHELKRLDLPHVWIEGVFLTKKLPPNPLKKQAAPQIFPSVQPQDFDKFRNKGPAPPPQRSPQRGPRRLDPEQPLHKQKPPPCNFYYLASCRQGTNCRFGHDYVLLPDQVNELRETSKRWPCPAVNRDHKCHLGEACCMAHTCPKGPRCSFAKAGKCKFVGKDMHKGFYVPRDRSRGGASSTAPSTHAPSSPSLESAYLSPLASPLHAALEPEEPVDYDGRTYFAYINEQMVSSNSLLSRIEPAETPSIAFSY